MLVTHIVLDRNKLNSLKALVFAKFPVEPSEERRRRKAKLIPSVGLASH